MIAQKNGVSASGLQTILGIGSYKTAWIWLHKLRALMVFPNRDKLTGKVEVDETFVGGASEGKRGRGSENKTLVIIAVEVLPIGTGRVRTKVIPNAEGKHLLKFIRENIEKGATITTDGWSGYAQLETKGYTHKIQRQVIAIRDEEMLPNAHRVAALLKRWLLGTHQNYTSPDRLHSYLDEFTFRYNRRKSNSRGLLFHRIIEQAISSKPILSRMVLKNKIK
jgi:transposase-like protein